MNNQIGLTIDRGHSWAMTQCVCGDVFQASGDWDDVRAQEATWSEQHKACAKVKREGSKVFWLSFCDAERPKGQQFLGACLVEVTAEDADAMAVEVAMRFPFAQPGAEWIGAAARKAHRLGCNPGGEVASVEVTDHPNLSRYTFGVLMDRATVEQIDRELETPPASDAVATKAE